MSTFEYGQEQSEYNEHWLWFIALRKSILLQVDALHREVLLVSIVVVAGEVAALDIN